MPALPWTTFQAFDADTTYVVMVSRLRLRRYRHVPGFLRAATAIRRQLTTSPGLLGYSLDAHLLRKTFWTLSAWTDNESLQTFNTTPPHRDVTARMRPRMGPTDFAFLTLKGNELPLAWEDARRRLIAAVDGEH
jgi:heme-degrading monooxygenase HmoA